LDKTPHKAQNSTVTRFSPLSSINTPDNAKTSPRATYALLNKTPQSTKKALDTPLHTWYGTTRFFFTRHHKPHQWSKQMQIQINDEQASSAITLATILTEIHELNYNEELEIQLCEEVLYNAEILT
jgi:hypothetical protein